MGKSIWMVRAGRGSEHLDDFLEQNLVAIGWQGAGAISANMDKKEIEQKIASSHEGGSDGYISTSASQLKRYYDEVDVGDSVATYDSNSKVYFLGEILSDVEIRDHPLGRFRQVNWTKKVSRNALLTSTRNSLGAIQTLFLIKNEAAEDMRNHAVPIDSSTEAPSVPGPTAEAQDVDRELMEEQISKAKEFTEDRIARLKPEEMEELVAEILFAMGYRAKVTPKGPDRGYDVFASPDGLGLQEPRVFVEVKHRPGTQMTSKHIRSFLGGRQPGDRCLYVSTGGFTKDARYEADRSNIPITLIMLPQLREILLEHYESLRPTGTALIPLEKLYWPAG